jgi:hypothetical protein
LLGTYIPTYAGEPEAESEPEAEAEAAPAALGSFTDRYWKALKPGKIEKEQAVGSEQAGELDVGEVFEGIEIAWIPDSIKGEGLTQRIKMKSLVDGEGGWVSVDSEAGTPVCEEVQKDGSKLPSTGRFFKALKPGLMKEGMNVESAKCGDLDVGEIFEALEIVEIPDTRDGEGLMTRIRMMSKVDGEGGWVSLDTKKGTKLIEEVPRPDTMPAGGGDAEEEEEGSESGSESDSGSEAEDAAA